jgi:hypothetical protein
VVAGLGRDAAGILVTHGLGRPRLICVRLGLRGLLERGRRGHLGSRLGGLAGGLDLGDRLVVLVDACLGIDDDRSVVEGHEA